MTKTLLIEIGVEELPAIPLLKELKNIEKKYLNVLEKYDLVSEFEFSYTPRRLTMWHREFPVCQDDKTEEFFGAPKAIALQDGSWSKAALGFAKKCGVDVEELSFVEKGGKEVLYYKREVKGKESISLLNDIVNEWIHSLDFGKSMRWGTLHDSFIRPVRWINVLLGDELVDVELFGVQSAKTTRVHRQKSFDALAVQNAKAYFELLKEGGVELYSDERKKRILQGFEGLEKQNNITIEIDSTLLDEVVAITEYPTPLLGKFDEKFLELPPEVIITSMKEHQRYFPVFKDGKLDNSFVVVSNAYTKDFSKIIEGNERVLRPRLEDALFFYKNDLQNGLSTDGLEKVVFLDGLGTLKEKIAREKEIALYLAKKYGIDEQKTSRAIELAKADLMSEMVYEFTELQGLMGYYYALALGEDEEVALAIKEQYMPNGEGDDLPSTKLSAIVAMSIKLDTLIGLFSIGMIPTGSRDPFALRRAVNGIVRIAREYELEFDIIKDISALIKGYKEFDIAVLEKFILERIRKFYKVNPSIIEAVLATGERELVRMGKKIETLNNVVQSESFKEASTTFKRVANISKDVDISQELHVNEDLFVEEAEKVLYSAYKDVISKEYQSYEEELDALLGLKPQLDNFFDNVMVNVEDEALKQNRKNLVASIYKSIYKIADIKEVSI
ncbi:MAG: glycine--tRNA ligase subunit beta [Epsilonproteobacteria bacterium]|nr:glycine--tRNA ligase subunit beta [Campylobacterota bacterium]